MPSKRSSNSCTRYREKEREMAAGAVKAQVTGLMVVVVMMVATSVVTVDAKLDFFQILGFFGNIETDSYEAVINKVITLKSSDGETFEVDEAVAVESQTIKHMIKDDCAENWIPLPNVTSKVLAKVIEYCKKHVEAVAVPKGGDDEDLKRWDAEFVKVDHATLFDLILAANYLDIQGLLDLTTQTLGSMIMGKTPEEIRKLFNITSDYTPTENLWAFE